MEEDPAPATAQATCGIDRRQLDEQGIREGEMRSIVRGGGCAAEGGIEGEGRLDRERERLRGREMGIEQEALPWR